MVRLPEKGNGDAQGKERDDAPSQSLAALSQEVKELVRLISATDVTELHLESGEVSITIKRGNHAQPSEGHSHSRPSTAYIPPATLPEIAPTNPIHLIGHNPAHGEELTLAEGEQAIVAPMVGTFYTASAPSQPPFVAVGDVIEPGQPIGIVEAMKMMNEIEAEFGGSVTRILVENAQPVEYGQPLMVVQTG